MEPRDVILERGFDISGFEAKVPESLGAPCKNARCNVPLPASEQRKGLSIVKTLLDTTQLLGRGCLGGRYCLEGVIKRRSDRSTWKVRLANPRKQKLGGGSTQTRVNQTLTNAFAFLDNAVDGVTLGSAGWQDGIG